MPSWRGAPNAAPHVGGQRCPPLPPVGRRGDSRETRAAGPHVRRQRREAVWRTPGLPSARPAPGQAFEPPPLPRSLQTQLRRPRRPPPEGRGAFKPKGLSHEESSLPPPRRRPTPLHEAHDRGHVTGAPPVGRSPGAAVEGGAWGGKTARGPLAEAAGDSGPARPRPARAALTRENAMGSGVALRD